MYTRNVLICLFVAASSALATYTYLSIFQIQPLINTLNSAQQNLEYETRKNTLVKAASSMNNESVVFLGSSSIEALDTNAISSDAINLGIAGEKLPRLLARVETYNNLSSAKAVVFMAGFNDLHDTALTVYQRFTQITQDLSETPLVIVGMQPTVSKIFSDSFRTHLNNYNIKLETFCANHMHCQYIDLSSELSLNLNDKFPAIDSFFKKDGIHLNDEGYEILKAQIFKALKNSPE